jgi:hypothetical protein
MWASVEIFQRPLENRSSKIREAGVFGKRLVLRVSGQGAKKSTMRRREIPVDYCASIH